MYLQLRNFFYTETLAMPFIQKRGWNKCEKEKLLKCFHSKLYPDSEELSQLAKSLNASRRRVENWFTYMRSKKVAEGMSLDSE